MTISDLLRPFSYLEITHPSGKVSTINWKYPFWLSTIAIFLLAICPFEINLWGNEGIAYKVLQLVQTLPGFYIAALTAVATFGNESIDKLMPGTPPEKTIIIGNAKQQTKLTRRLFLSSMFSYLTVLSIALTLGLIALLSIANGVKAESPESLHIALKYLAIFPVLLFFSQLLTVTSWGLYYLGERMHISDS